MNVITKKTADHIWSHDPAIDSDATGYLEAYRSALQSGDVSGIPIREGHKPAVFKLQRLSRRLFLRLEGKKGFHADNELVAYGLVGVEGLEVNGTPFRLEMEKVDGAERVKGDCLDTIHDPQLFAELATHVILLSKLDPTSGQGS